MGKPPGARPGPKPRPTRPRWWPHSATPTWIRKPRQRFPSFRRVAGKWRLMWTSRRSSKEMRPGEIIAIGSELLLGGRLDTNSLFLTEQLASVGVEVRFKSVVGDVEADIAAAMRTAARRAAGV